MRVRARAVNTTKCPPAVFATPFTYSSHRALTADCEKVHDEQDDAEGGRRDWEEDPLGFDTKPMLLRAMCMAFE